MHRYFKALVFIAVASGCREHSVVERPAKSDQFPWITIQEGADGKSTLIARVSNPSSSELSIPGFAGDLIYGSYWYQDDKVINVPMCGTGFWHSVIKIPAGQTRQLRLPIPLAATRGNRYTVAVVYAGLGPSLGEEDRKKVSPEERIRHPDISMNCRKMETQVNLTAD